MKPVLFLPTVLAFGFGVVLGAAVIQPKVNAMKHALAEAEEAKRIPLGPDPRIADLEGRLARAVEERNRAQAESSEAWFQVQELRSTLSALGRFDP